MGASRVTNGQPLQEGEPPLDATRAQETMARLRTEAAQCKQRRAELAAELQRMSSDPAAANDEAVRLEQEAGKLRERLTVLRSTELVELEHEHNAKRDAWQRATTQMQELRIRKDAAERECSSVRQDL